MWWGFYATQVLPGAYCNASVWHWCSQSSLCMKARKPPHWHRTDQTPTRVQHTATSKHDFRARDPMSYKELKSNARVSLGKARRLPEAMTTRSKQCVSNFTPRGVLLAPRVSAILDYTCLPLSFRATPWTTPPPVWTSPDRPVGLPPRAPHASPRTDHSWTASRTSWSNASMVD